MKAHPLAAAVVTGAALVGATATAHAEPTAAHPQALTFVDHGVTYAVTDDGPGPIAHAVAGGRFVPGADAHSVIVIDDAGAAAATIPLGLHSTSGQTTGVTASIGDGGRTLALTRAPESAAAHQIDEASDTIARKQHNAGIGAVIGGGIGAVLGFFLGGVGALLTIPIGAGIGALIGYSTP